MRSALTALVALLALAPACAVDDAPGAGAADQGTRGERCDDMATCGRGQCGAEIAALRSCLYDSPPCDLDVEMVASLQEQWAACLDDNGCNTTSCDLAGALTDKPDLAEEYCDSASDAELLNLARISMFVGSPDAMSECQALE